MIHNRSGVTYFLGGEIERYRALPLAGEDIVCVNERSGNPLYWRASYHTVSRGELLISLAER